MNIDWRNLLVTDVKHDKAIFRKGDKILPEGTIRQIAEDVVTGHYRREEEMLKCDEFHMFCSLTSDAFLNSSLQQARAKFNFALHELGEHTSTHFSLVSKGTFRLQPVYLPSQSPDLYKHHSAILDGLSSKMMKEYSTFRKIVKQRLDI